MAISDELLRFVLYGRMRTTLQHDYSMQDYLWTGAPSQVCIQATSIPGAQLGVFCCQPIRKGTQIGPFLGNLSQRLDHCTANCWEIFDPHGDIVGYIDGGTRPLVSWLSYIQCARTDREQNLEVVQIGRDIFYRAIKDIERGDELLVWYGSAYRLYMGLPYMVSEHMVNSSPASLELEHNDAGKTQSPCHEHAKSSKGGKWKCILCGRGFNSRSNLRSHMRIHTLEKPFSCKYCGRRFSQSSTLRNHVRLHTGEKPYKCLVCKSSYSQLAGLRAHQRSSRHSTGILRQ